MTNELSDQDGTDERGSDRANQRDTAANGTAESTDAGVKTAWNEALALDARAESASDVPPERTQPSRPSISTDRLFQVLSSPGNRFVLTYLLRVDGPVEYAELVEYVVAEADPPDEMDEAKFRGRVAATLINERLPELRDAGLVEVDGTRQLVSPTAATSVAAPYLALALSQLIRPPRGD